MDQPEGSAVTRAPQHPNADSELPPGSHPLEVAARRGIGPLSPFGGDVWHGRTRPCVSCGQLVLRDDEECDHCGQNLSREMIEKMRAHAGPWYVLEHVRPFPGVSLERIIRQIRRGLITETSIVCGPSADYQWRFAVETPGLCRYFGRCWSCHEQVSPSDTYCQHCLSSLSFEQAKPAPDGTESTAGADGSQSPERKQRVQMEDKGKPGLPMPAGQPNAVAPTPSDELKQLSAVVDRADLPAHEPIWDDPPRIGGIRATWIAAAVLAVVIAALMLLT